MGSQAIFIQLLVVGVIHKAVRIGEHPERRHLHYINCVTSPDAKISLIKERFGGIITFSVAGAVTKIF